jgi:5S rRNA maturation endonuclease (ribonuclease M5)
MADLCGDGGAVAVSTTSSAHRQVEIAYSFLDEKRMLLYQTVRYAPKGFSVRRPDGQGGWISNLTGTRRVLYRLPELVEGIAAGRSVYICEGEKDVDAMRAVGAVATCNPHGAGKWKPEFSDCLQGARVTIVADKDAPGYAHAADVAESLSSVAASVCVVVAAVRTSAARRHIRPFRNAFPLLRAFSVAPSAGKCRHTTS